MRYVRVYFHIIVNRKIQIKFPMNFIHIVHFNILHYTLVSLMHVRVYFWKHQHVMDVLSSTWQQQKTFFLSMKVQTVMLQKHRKEHDIFLNYL